MLHASSTPGAVLPAPRVMGAVLPATHPGDASSIPPLLLLLCTLGAVLPAPRARNTTLSGGSSPLSRSSTPPRPAHQQPCRHCVRPYFQKSADVKVMRVDARSVKQAHVVGAASITDAVEQNTSRDSRCVACSTIGMKETPRELRWLKVYTSQDMSKSTRNAATRKCLTIPLRL